MIPRARFGEVLPINVLCVMDSSSPVSELVRYFLHWFFSGIFPPKCPMWASGARPAAPPKWVIGQHLLDGVRQSVSHSRKIGFPGIAGTQKHGERP